MSYTAVRDADHGVTGSSLRFPVFPVRHGEVPRMDPLAALPRLFFIGITLRMDHPYTGRRL